MRTHIRDRDITFRLQDGCLVRTISGPDGRVYIQRCSLKVFETVAWVIEETPNDGDGVVLAEIVSAEDVPHTQADIALAFLNERGIIDRRHRRNYPASTSVHLDAMCEWYALREEPKDDAKGGE